MDSSRLLTVKQAADMLGLTTQAMYFQKTRLGGRKIEGKGIVFDRERIEMAARKRELAASTTGTATTGRPVLEGKSSGLIFAALKKGASLIDIVIEHSVSPELVHRLAAEYANMQGSLLLTGEHLARFAKLPLADCVVPPTWTAASFMLVLEQSLAPPGFCSKCQKRPAQLCGMCRAR